MQLASLHSFVVPKLSKPALWTAMFVCSSAVQTHTRY